MSLRVSSRLLQTDELLEGDDPNSPDDEDAEQVLAQCLGRQKAID